MAYRMILITSAGNSLLTKILQQSPLPKPMTCSEDCNVFSIDLFQAFPISNLVAGVKIGQWTAQILN